jgi:hypothetical protein
MPIFVMVSAAFIDVISKYISFVFTPSTGGIRSPPKLVVTIFVHAENKKAESRKNKAKYFFTRDEFME